MYLKTLTLKGFKSFANKTTFNLEPGITCIVGPNGSGKSNISDAILWVLGERSAKNIRGEAMEDVIFSGAKNKSKAAMAEVTLVLDNSDGTLNIDYSDVSITRRIYRNGESEYLLNNSPVRRLDIIGVLHDSGLGTATNSIISQGALDSVLHYDEIQLRSIVEDAAGVLKYKQKKEKSIKKLNNLENNFTRINDIVREVERQLIPLKNKSEKAKIYLSLKEESNKLELKIASNNYKNQLAKKNALEKEISTTEQELNESISKIQEKNNQISTLDSKAKKINENSLIQSKQQATFGRLEERLKSSIFLLENASEQAIQALNNLGVDENSYDNQIKKLRDEASDIEQQITKNNELVKSQESEIKEIDDECAQLKQNIDNYDEIISSSTKEITNIDKKLEQNSNKLNELKASLLGKSAHMEVLDSQIASIKKTISSLNDQKEDIKSSLNSLSKLIKDGEEADNRNKKIMADCLSSKQKSESALSESEAQIKALEAQILALEKIDNSAKYLSDIGKLIKNSPNLSNMNSLSKIIEVDPKYENITEILLNRYLNSLLAPATTDFLKIREEVYNSQFDQTISFINENANIKHVLIDGQPRLIDYIKCDNNYKMFVENALGDVYIAKDLKNALNLSEEYNHAIRIITNEGDFVGERGEVVLNLNIENNSSGILVRKRQLDEYKNSLTTCISKTNQLKESVAKAVTSLTNAQKESFSTTESLVKLKAEEKSVSSSLEDIEKNISSQQEQLEQVENNKGQTTQFLDNIEPSIKQIEDENQDLSKNKENFQTTLQNSREKREILSLQIDDLKDKKHKINNSYAANLERKNYLNMIFKSKNDDINRIKKDKEEANRKTDRANRCREFVNSNVEILVKIQQVLQEKLANKFVKSEDDKQKLEEIYNQVSILRDDLKSNYNERDNISKAISDKKIELAQIEMRIESQLHKIEKVLQVNIEEALSLENIEDINKTRQDLEKINRKIERLGNIDFSAAEEYEELNKRYEFLQSHLKDISDSIQCINKIDKLIEVRFVEEFDKTQKLVSQKFSEIFHTLFPGGSGEVVLTNKEDLANTGIAIKANPAGKKIYKMSLLSGGERSLVAIAFLFALYSIRNAPFFILDEVEAALDDSNLMRLLDYIKMLKSTSQFILITHQRSTMEMADVLFGISMHEDGITKVISQRLDGKYAS